MLSQIVVDALPQRHRAEGSCLKKPQCLCIASIYIYYMLSFHLLSTAVAIIIIQFGI